MRRLLLRGAVLFSIATIALTCAMWSRSDDVMDWLRISALDRSAVIASSRAHVGAAIVVDGTAFERSNRPVRYRHFRPADLRKTFPEHVLGFAYGEEDGVYFVLCPMWALVAGALIPPIVWVQQRTARRARRFSTQQNFPKIQTSVAS